MNHVDSAQVEQEFNTPMCWPCETARRWLRWLWKGISTLYVFIFARPSGQKINDFILALALRGRGYNNCCDLKTTGEAYFLNLISKTNPKLCVDVGANKGSYSKFLLEGTTAHVISFEPLPRAYLSLKALAAAYPGRLTPENVGVGRENTKLELLYGAEDSELASFSEDVCRIDYVRASNINRMTVPVLTLDSYLDRFASWCDRIDLLKIDTEGFEYEVLLGAREVFAKLQPRFVQIEYNWHQLLRGHSLRLLASLMPGYKAYQILPHGSGLVFREIDRPETNICLYSNFVFVRDDAALCELLSLATS